MAGTDNLEPVRSKDEAKERGRKGGIASGEARRRKKTMRETLEAVLAMQVGDGKSTDIEAITKFAQLKGKNITVQEAMIIAQAQKALKGDLAALQFIRDTMGQKPTDNMNLVAEMTPLVIKDDVCESD
jgi:hypothetical protein